jgi:hypothetical protein
MERRGFFTGIAGMITGTAVAQPKLQASSSVGFNSVEFTDCDFLYTYEGKKYKLTPTKSICTMPFNDCGLAHQINLARPILMLEEV